MLMDFEQISSFASKWLNKWFKFKSKNKRKKNVWKKKKLIAFTRCGFFGTASSQVEDGKNDENYKDHQLHVAQRHKILFKNKTQWNPLNWFEWCVYLDYLQQSNGVVFTAVSNARINYVFSEAEQYLCVKVKSEKTLISLAIAPHNTNKEHMKKTWQW